MYTIRWLAYVIQNKNYSFRPSFTKHERITYIILGVKFLANDKQWLKQINSWATRLFMYLRPSLVDSYPGYVAYEREPRFGLWMSAHLGLKQILPGHPTHDVFAASHFVSSSLPTWCFLCSTNQPDPPAYAGVIPALWTNQIPYLPGVFPVPRTNYDLLPKWCFPCCNNHSDPLTYLVYSLLTHITNDPLR